MNRTALYELGVATGKSLVTENDNIKLSAAISTAASENSVDSADFPQFTQYVTQARQLYKSLASQLLPSEQIAARAKQQADITAAREKKTAPVAAVEHAAT